MKINIHNKIIKFINKNLILCSILCFLVLIFLQFNKTAFDIYYIYEKNHDTRLTDSYENIFYSGFCQKQSHGYIIYIKNKFKPKIQKNFIPKIINLENRNIPYWLFMDGNKKVNNKQIILLNFKEKYKMNFDLSNYKILDNFEDRCFFLEKYD